MTGGMHYIPSHTADVELQMLKLGRVTNVKVFFLVLVYIFFNFDSFEFSAAIYIINSADKTKLSCNTPTDTAPQFL